MNLIEAVKSGRPFRRNSSQASHPDYFKIGAGGYIYWTRIEDNSLQSWRPKEDDLLADDWETQEPEVTITASAFWEAVHDVLPSIPGNILNGVNRDNFKMLAKRLGLGGEK